MPIYEMNEINVYIRGMKCLECGKDLINTDGKRAKKFCNNTCRSNFWQKQNRKNKPKVVAVKNLNEPTNQVKPVTQPTTNFVMDTTKEEQIRELEEKIKLVPNGQYYNKVVAGLRTQINNIKNSK